MRILLALLLVSILSITALAQRESSNTGSSIAGRVSDGERGVANIAIVVLPGEFTVQRATIARTTTDGQGRYQILNLPAGKYSLIAIAPNYAISDDTTRFRGKVVTLSSGETIDGLDFSITRGGVITGKIVHQDGRPLIEQRIDLMRVDENGRKHPITPTNYLSMLTDDRGVYRIYGLPAGKYQLSVGETTSPNRLRVSLNSTRLPLTFYPGVIDEEKTELIEVSEGSEVTGIDLTIGQGEKAYKVSGKIIDGQTGKLMAGVRLGYGLLREDNQLLVGSFGIKSDTRGEFQLIGLLPGRYGVAAFSDGTADFYSDKTPFEIVDHDLSGVEIKLWRGGRVRGVVTFDNDSAPEATRGLSSLELNGRVTNSDNNAPDISWINPSRVNGDGTFQFVGLPPGRLELFISQFPKGKGYTIKRLERNGQTLSNGVEIAAGEQINDLRLVLSYGNGVIKGQIKLINDTQPQGQTRRLFVLYKNISSDVNARVALAEVDSLGRFTIEGLPAGDYELTARAILPQQEPRSAPKQLVTVGNGATVEAIINFDLDVKENEE